MKPTDEAKRLRDEIVDYIERQDDPQLCAEWIMGKVLDRVVLNIRAVGGPSDPLDSLDIGFDEGIDVAIKVINNLRQKP